MTTLEAKLTELLHEYVSGIAFDIGPEARNDIPMVAAILEAVKEAGYVKMKITTEVYKPNLDDIKFED